VTCLEKRFHGPEENYTNAFSKAKSFIPEDVGNLSHKVYDLVNFCPHIPWFYVAVYFSILEGKKKSEPIRIRLS
jgi:hypothetical protein